MATQRTVGESPASAQRTMRRPLIDFTQPLGYFLLAAAVVPIILAWVFVSLTGGLLILRSIWRCRKSGARRKPPGVL